MRDHGPAPNLGLARTWDLHLDAAPAGAASAAPGCSFAGGSDPTLPDSLTVTIDPAQATDWVAYFD